jgi:hypothetical protein
MISIDSRLGAIVQAGGAIVQAGFTIELMRKLLIAAMCILRYE